MKVLVTGGAGYIGSHMVVELLNNNYEVVVIDNLQNSKIEVIDRIKQITSKNFKFYKENILNTKALEVIFETEKFDAIIHFAGLKAVGESFDIPLNYYETNVYGTLNILKMMEKYNVYNLVFSSSATVYGIPEKVPLDENCKVNPLSPYGNTKLICEYLIKDFEVKKDNFGFVILRYFNPIGAHPSGLIGEDPNGIPNNLVPYISKTIKKEYEFVRVFGNDYNTVDGTGVRDYIHVMDLVDGHLLALEKLKNSKGVYTYNLGTGTGYSVMDVINAFSQIVGSPVPYKIMERRSGDVDVTYSNPQKAFNELGFKAKRDLNQMCTSQYKWELNNK